MTVHVDWIQCMWTGSNARGLDPMHVDWIQCTWTGSNACGLDPMHVDQMECMWMEYNACCLGVTAHFSPFLTLFFPFFLFVFSFSFLSLFPCSLSFHVHLLSDMQPFLCPEFHRWAQGASALVTSSVVYWLPGLYYVPHFRKSSKPSFPPAEPSQPSFPSSYTPTTTYGGRLQNS